MNVHDSSTTGTLDYYRSIPRDLLSAPTIQEQLEQLPPSQVMQEFARTERLRGEVSTSLAKEVMGHSSALEAAAQHAAPAVLAIVQEERRREMRGESAALKQAAATLERVRQTCGAMDYRAFTTNNALDQAIEATSFSAQHAFGPLCLEPWPCRTLAAKEPYRVSAMPTETAKLTIRLPTRDIEFAKSYAKANGLTVTEVINRYLRRMRALEDQSISPELDAITGLVPPDVDAKAQHRRFLGNKHSP